MSANPPTDPAATPPPPDSSGTPPPPTPPPPADPLSAERDSLGRPFDPAKFKPERDKLGRWKNLHAGRGGRAASASAADPAAANFDDIEKLARGAAAPAGTASPLNPSDEYTQAAAGVVAGISTVAILALGAHVAPNADQTGAMVRAYADAFRVYGVAPKAPPWIAPAIATAAWVGPHLADRRSQERLQGWRARWVNFVLWFRGRRDARAATAAASQATAQPAPAP